jgi:hypothetical protein
MEMEMSNYRAMTIHPETKIPEMADWIDDHFGKHHYGVRFPSDRKIFSEDECKLHTKDRFTVGWDGERHRGKRLGTLWWNDYHYEGDVTVSALFQNMSRLEKMDALQDVIGLLQREYDACFDNTEKSLVPPNEDKDK